MLRVKCEDCPILVRLKWYEGRVSEKVFERVWRCDVNM